MSLYEEPVGLMFFRKGISNPEGIIVSEQEAKEAIKHFSNLHKNKSDYIWCSKNGRLTIDLRDVSAVRYTDVEEAEEDEDEDDENGFDKDLKFGYSPDN